MCCGLSACRCCVLAIRSGPVRLGRWFKSRLHFCNGGLNPSQGATVHPVIWTSSLSRSILEKIRYGSDLTLPATDLVLDSRPRRADNGICCVVANVPPHSKLAASMPQLLGLEDVARVSGRRGCRIRTTRGRATILRSSTPDRPNDSHAGRAAHMAGTMKFIYGVTLK